MNEPNSRLPHCIRSQQFTRAKLEKLFALADKLHAGQRSYALKDKIVISLFYEPSTRTRLSFESAVLRLGGSIIGTENAAEFSSAIKGESLGDSIRIISSYGDVIILRHKDDDAAECAASQSTVPIISAGCGKGQHPTQALLDLYTIRQRRGKIDGLRIVMCGDLKHGRTVRSLAYLLGKFKDVHITFVAPETLRIGRDILSYLDRHDVRYEETGRLADVAPTVDVIYTTRVQRERIPGLEHGAFVRLQQEYRIDRALAGRMHADAFIMHPLPRNDELSTDVDDTPHAAYFQQAQNGLWVRMSLLHMMFS